MEDADYMRHDIDNVELKRALTHVNAEMRLLRARNDELVGTVECMREDGLRKEHDHRVSVIFPICVYFVSSDRLSIYSRRPKSTN